MLVTYLKALYNGRYQQRNAQGDPMIKYTIEITKPTKLSVDPEVTRYARQPRTFKKRIITYTENIYPSNV